LIGVVLTGEDERLLDALAVDRDHRIIRVLLNDREQIPEQAAFKVVEILMRDIGARGTLGAADRLAVRSELVELADLEVQQRPPVLIGKIYAAVAALLCRNLRPSSSRC
jgi:hypothetical protein